METHRSFKRVFYAVQRNHIFAVRGLPIFVARNFRWFVVVCKHDACQEFFVVF